MIENVEDFVPFGDYILAPNHDGAIGWHWTENGWVDPNAFVLTTEIKAERARKKRNNLLKQNVDPMNPVRWEALTQTQKDDWIAYRQALLDVPQQEGFPNNIIWPTKPSY